MSDTRQQPFHDLVEMCSQALPAGAFASWSLSEITQFVLATALAEQNRSLLVAALIEEGIAVQPLEVPMDEDGCREHVYVPDDSPPVWRTVRRREDGRRETAFQWLFLLPVPPTEKSET